MELTSIGKAEAILDSDSDEKKTRGFSPMAVRNVNLAAQDEEPNILLTDLLDATCTAEDQNPDSPDHDRAQSE